MAAPQTLAHWWNGSAQPATRRDVWVERLDDDRYRVRWRGGDWCDRDGLHVTASRQAAWDAVRALLGDEPDSWRRLV
jgi:hypothetical protein